MLKDSEAFSGFSVDDIETAKTFYGDTLGLKLEAGGPGFTLKLTGGTNVLVYAKPDHHPATYTVLNFPVNDIDATIKEMQTTGINFEHYDGMTDNAGVLRGKSKNMGPDIAWFKDPAGNILSILSNN